MIFLSDHTINPFYFFQVKAVDSGMPPRATLAEVFIQILDENDNNPIFAHEPTALIIPENIPAGI